MRSPQFPALTRPFREAIARRLTRDTTAAGIGLKARPKAREAARRAGVVDDADFERRSQRRAAIFVPLVNVGGETSLLFTQRTDVVSTHKNQVSFPGGHIDPGESVEVAAVRELCEELLHGHDALQQSLIGAGDAALRGDGRLTIEILGTGPTVRAVTGTLCTCIIGYLSGTIPDEHAWSRSPDEVETIFTVPISTLQEVRDVEDLGNRGMNIATYSHPDFPARIWGLTAHLADSIIRDVFEPAAVHLATNTNRSRSKL